MGIISFDSFWISDALVDFFVEDLSLKIEEIGQDIDLCFSGLAYPYLSLDENKKAVWSLQAEQNTLINLRNRFSRP